MLDLRLRHDTSVAAWLFDAVPYLLPVHDAVSVLDSRPQEPDMLAELRLPFPAVTVYFGADLEFDPAFLRWSEGLDEPARQFPAQVAQAAYGGEPPSVAMTDLINRIRTLGGYLTGITMFANTHGGLVDEALFVVATNPDPSFTDGRAKDRPAARSMAGCRARPWRRWSPTWRWRCSGAHGSSHLPGLGCRPIRACGPGARPPTPAAFDERTPRCPGRVRVLATERTHSAGRAAQSEGRRATPAARLRQATGAGCGLAPG